MFTGIIKYLGRVIKIKKNKTNIDFTLECNFTKELKVHQSLSHNGVCLTIVKIQGDKYTVNVTEESLKKSNLNDLQIGSLVNLERCITLNGQLDGHIVQGHIDQIGIVQSIKNKNGSYLIKISYIINKFITVEKGSITINGISLTIIDSKKDSFLVSIIPYTWKHTNINQLQINDRVNLEFDIIGKYIQKLYNSKFD